MARAESNILTEPTAGVAVWWGIVWFIGNWLNNTALGLTSVASMTIIATTSGRFLLGRRTRLPC
jgi:solute carrier family 35 protein F5